MTESTAAVLTPDQWRERYLSRYPLATDNLDMGAWREHRERALRRQYVETSPRALVAAVVIDVDRPDAVLRAFERPSDHPMPSWVVEGNQGHGHVGWWLTAPVCRTDAAGRSAAVPRSSDGGTAPVLDGDPATGLLTRNPLRPGGVIWGTNKAYSLRELGTVTRLASSPQAGALQRARAQRHDVRHGPSPGLRAARSSNADGRLAPGRGAALPRGQQHL